MIDPFDRPVPRTITLQEDQVYVLCEGQDEAAMVRAVAKAEGLALTAGLCSERDSLGGELRQFRLAAERIRPRALGVIVDKEKDALKAEANLKKSLDLAGFTVTLSPGAITNAALADTDLKLGYFLNPDHASAGAIEQLFVGQIALELSSCVEDFVVCVERTKQWDNKQSLDILKDKVRLRTYLAARKAGGNTGLSVALDDKNLNVDTPHFNSVKDFLRRLCS